MSSITSLFPIGLQSQFRPENTNSSGNAIRSAYNSDRPAPSSRDSPTDNTELSQFAELMSGLRLIAQTDPGQYRAILAAIGASISNAAEDTSGNSAAAGMIAQLESDFSDANTTVQPPFETQPSTTE
jgi:hypothetical protein